MSGRIDVITVFGEYLSPLELSLVGKARRRGLVDVVSHDLRDWTSDRHRTVDDTPFGGGAGMVMRPDVWGRAIDAVLQPSAPVRVLIMPTPAGDVLRQQDAQQWAQVVADGGQVVIACGRYEGIDARLAQHYDADPQVLLAEVSLGDYVLNGGEVAALAITEAVVRLLPGVLGNPQSVVEESHGVDGLLEYPVYTQPPDWRGLSVPPVLRSGDHGRIAQWRRAQAVERTARRRPDLVAEHPVTIRAARPADAPMLAELAADTFPLACPADMAMDDIAQFVAENLSEQRFRSYLKDRSRWLLIARVAGAAVGYSMTVAGEPGDGQVAQAVPLRPTAELSKFYVRPEHHRRGIAASLMAATKAAAIDRGLPGLWLGVNDRNERAKRFYAKHGFTRIGARNFTVGAVRASDDVLFVRFGDG
ncbi:MAG: tRNA (guanosine(37)-N1)-methyltransferase TrmD [Beutenbergiaceae bacterium]